MIVVGIDPDAERHGIAVYRDGKLQKLAMMQAIEIIEGRADGVLYAMENVMANKFVYRRNVKASRAVADKVAMSIGRVQQAQVELMRLFDHYAMPYVLYKPMKSNWANDKPMFERVTGWTGSSNQDTRAAAFFGYLAMRDGRGR